VSTADLLVEAIDAFAAVAEAVAQWLIFFATVASILALVAIATGAWGVRAVWRRTPRPSFARRRRRSRPLWSTSQPLDYEEAA
jgi:hypothetical protein